MKVKLKRSRVVDEGNRFVRQRAQDVIEVTDAEGEALILTNRAVPADQDVVGPNRRSRMALLKKPTKAKKPAKGSASHDDGDNTDVNDNASSWATLPISHLGDYVPAKVVDALAEEGYLTLADVAEAEDLTETEGIGAKVAERIRLAIDELSDEES